MSATPKYQEHDYPPKSTMPENLAWLAAALGAAVWVIAWFILQGADYASDEAGALAWMGAGAWLVGVAVVPAVLLTGIRHLLPSARAYFPLAGRVPGGEQVPDAENG